MSTEGRVMILEGHPPLHPGFCWLCKSIGGDGRKFVDFATSMPRHGRIYWCSYCFEEVCSALGWISPANAENMEMQVLAMENNLNIIKDENAKLRDLVGSSIPQLMEHLSAVQKVSTATNGTVKRSPGRPKKAESGTP